MEKPEIRPFATSKPLKRSSPKVSYLTNCWIYPHAKFSHNPSKGFFTPYARNCASKCLLGFFLGSNAPQARPRTDFHTKYIKQRGSVQGCAFTGLENKKLTFKPPYSRKSAIFRPDDFDGTWKTFGRKPLYNGDAPCKLLLVIIVAP